MRSRTESASSRRRAGASRPATRRCRWTASRRQPGQAAGVGVDHFTATCRRLKPLEGVCRSERDALPGRRGPAARHPWGARRPPDPEGPTGPPAGHGRCGSGARRRQRTVPPLQPRQHAAACRVEQLELHRPARLPPRRSGTTRPRDSPRRPRWFRQRGGIEQPPDRSRGGGAYISYPDPAVCGTIALDTGETRFRQNLGNTHVAHSHPDRRLGA